MYVLGLLGTLTSILLVYLGVQAGRIILCYHYTFSRISRWTVWAAVAVSNNQICVLSLLHHCGIKVATLMC